MALRCAACYLPIVDVTMWVRATGQSVEEPFHPLCAVFILAEPGPTHHGRIEAPSAHLATARKG